MALPLPAIRIGSAWLNTAITSITMVGNRVNVKFSSKGKFGTISLNQTRGESWRGAFVVKAVGGYGYSGWIWETAGGAFRIKQGPKLLSLETAAEREA